MGGILVHEWLAKAGGSENVFEEMCKVFPDARRWCLWDDSGGRFGAVNETVLARTPLRRSKALALPFMPFVWRHLPEASADWILVSSHLFAHHARFRGAARSAPKFVYAHTPARYIWAPELDQRGNNPLARLASAVLKPVDRAAAKDPVAIAANSAFTAARVQRAWQRDAQVIYPPVDVVRFSIEPDISGRDAAILETLPEKYLLGVSRFVPYKRLEEAIRAGRSTGLPVVIAGSGPDESRLRQLAESIHPFGVIFVLAPTTELLTALYRGAAAVVFAPIEDFGIIPVEAMAAGTPVVANAVGGAAESIIDGSTGAHVHEWRDEHEVASAVERAIAVRASDCRARASMFSTERFADGISAFVRERMDHS